MRKDAERREGREEVDREKARIRQKQQQKKHTLRQGQFFSSSSF